jgi:hypothetical protein
MLQSESFSGVWCIVRAEFWEAKTHRETQPCSWTMLSQAKLFRLENVD